MKFDLNDFLHPDDFVGKTVFWDIDGTLAAYRFNGHVLHNKGEGEWYKSCIDGGIFRKRPPSRFMQRIVTDNPAQRHVIVGHYCHQREVDDKRRWIKKHYPRITETLFIEYPQSKAEVIIGFCKAHNISLNDAMFIDDSVSILAEAEQAGIKVWHVSSLFDYFEEPKF